MSPEIPLKNPGDNFESPRSRKRSENFEAISEAIFGAIPGRMSKIVTLRIFEEETPYDTPLILPLIKIMRNCWRTSASNSKGKMHKDSWKNLKK